MAREEVISNGRQRVRCRVSLASKGVKCLIKSICVHYGKLHASVERWMPVLRSSVVDIHCDALPLWFMVLGPSILLSSRGSSVNENFQSTLRFFGCQRRQRTFTRRFCTRLLPYIFALTLTAAARTLNTSSSISLFFPVSPFAGVVSVTKRKIANKAICICEWHLFHHLFHSYTIYADPNENYTPSSHSTRQRSGHMPYVCACRERERERSKWNKPKRIKS